MMGNNIFCMEKNGWRLTKALAVLVVLVGLLSSATAQSKHYFYQYESPDAVVYLPAPPDTSSLLFDHDVSCWKWGKSMRNTPRGEQASWESLYGMERFASVFGEALDIEISKEKTPTIWKFIQKAAVTGDSAVKSAKVYYMRVRPFARMGEHVFGQFDDEEGLRHNGSYPSGHTATGWAIALALAEMAPGLQDTILRRGYEYGQSRVIVGAHWQSDVNAGRLASSAAFARMHTSPDYAGELAAARAEFLKLRPEMAQQQSGYPEETRILDAPNSPGTSFFYKESIPHDLVKPEQAHQDIESLYTGLSTAAGGKISSTITPNTIKLLTWISKTLCDPSHPFTAFAIGWSTALAMTELVPERQNEILKFGYEYDHNLVAAGYHLDYDVQAGQTLAACVLARMHSDPEFVQLLELAKKEWGEVKSEK